MTFIQHLLSASILFSLLLSYMPTDAQTDCPETLSTIDFIEYVKRFPVCRVSNSMRTLFRHYAPILDSLFDDDDKFIEQINYGDVDAFCSDVAGCKNALSACQGKLHEAIEDAGRALCEDGKAKTEELKQAISTLSNGGCDLSKQDDITLSRDGCYLGRDEALPQTYALDITRKKKIDSAQERCSLRFMKSHGICPSVEGAKAYGTILAASQDLELIDTMYDSYTSFRQEFKRDRKSMKLFGLTHLSYDDGAPTTCTGSPGNLLLWNTRVRITGSFSTLTPQSSFHILSQIVIEFYGADGVFIDSYMASDIDAELSYQTERQQANLPSDISARKIVKNQVLLTYSGKNDFATTISVGHYGNNLAVVVFMPSELLRNETVGLLIDGCQLYGSGGSSNVELGVTSDCTNECNSVEKHQSQCAADCSNQVSQYTELYNSLESLTEAASDFSYVSSSVSLTGNILLLAVAALSCRYTL